MLPARCGSSSTRKARAAVGAADMAGAAAVHVCRAVCAGAGIRAAAVVVGWMRSADALTRSLTFRVSS